MVPIKRSRVIQKLLLLWSILKRRDEDGRKKWSWFRLSWRFPLQLAINDCWATIVGRSEQWMESSNVSSNCGWDWNGMQDVVPYQMYLATWRVKSRDHWMREVMSKHLIRGLRRFMCVNHWRGSRWCLLMRWRLKPIRENIKVFCTKLSFFVLSTNLNSEVSSTFLERTHQLLNF